MKIVKHTYLLFLRIPLIVIMLLVFQTTIFAELPDRPTPGLPERPGVGLPTRPATPTPPPLIESEQEERSEVENGARIVLRLKSTSIDYWAVLQWEDTSSKWHDVDGWRGQFDQNQEIRWWVESKNFDTGPFRWVIYTKQDDHDIKFIWISSSFQLPKQGEVLIVTVP